MAFGCSRSDPVAEGPTAEPTHHAFFIQAHADDWALFVGDRAFAAADSGQHLVFVYVTAGDAGKPAKYWTAREVGALAAIQRVVGGQVPVCAALTINGRRITNCTVGRAAAYFLRLPDGGDGGGFPAYGNQSIELLQRGGGPILTVDSSASYSSWSDLVSTLNAIMVREAGSNPVATYASEVNRGRHDHADHFATGDLTAAATAGLRISKNWFLGYSTSALPANLDPIAYQEKKNAFFSYDSAMVRSGFAAIYDSTYDAWLRRTYVRSEAP